MKNTSPTENRPLDEIASVLALGFLRLRQKKASRVKLSEVAIHEENSSKASDAE